MQQDSGQQDRVGTREEAIANARRLLRFNAAAAAEQAREVISGDEQCAEAHRILGLALRRTGNLEQARQAESEAIRLSSLQKPLFQAALWLASNRLDSVEHILRPYLKEQPDDAVALRMLAEIGARTGHFDDAEILIQRALAVAPDYSSAKSLLASIRRARERAGMLDGSIRSTVGKEHLAPNNEPPSDEEDYQEALALYRAATSHDPANAQNWVSYGHVLRVIGRSDEAISAYRRAIEASPMFGEAWWALADLKTVDFSDADIESMIQFLRSSDVDERDQSYLRFSLGRAFEQRRKFAESFACYAEANRIRGTPKEHDPQAVARHVSKCLELFDADFFDARVEAGFDALDPIFIVGLPRAGSTLIEQILSSHSSIEGTMELPDIDTLAKHLGEGKKAGFEDSRYLENLAALNSDELRRFGQSYIWSTGLRRRTNRPRFIDKMPNNWLHVGLILLILPKAKIIDARRHPLACGLSIFRQHFARGQEFSYNLDDIGRFYVDYVRLMRHFDELFPDRIFRVFHEQLVESPEDIIRSMLDYVDVPFERACLTFHENRRAVRTSSSEQVRRPINREGLDQWRAFEPWLDELKRALGPVLDCYPEIPESL